MHAGITQIAATQMSCQFYKSDTMMSTFTTAQSWQHRLHLDVYLFPRRRVTIDIIVVIKPPRKCSCAIDVNDLIATRRRVLCLVTTEPLLESIRISTFRVSAALIIELAVLHGSMAKSRRLRSVLCIDVHKCCQRVALQGSD